MAGSGVAVSVFAGEVFTPEGATEFAARVHESTCREFGAIVAGAELTVTGFWPDGRRREPGTWDEAFAVFPDRVYATWQARGRARRRREVTLMIGRQLVVSDRGRGGFDPEHIRWHVRLRVEPATAANQKRLVRLLEEWGGWVELSYAEAGPGAGVSAGSELERAIGLPSPEGAEHAMQTLRGYSWVTVCPEPILRRLGGVAALAGCGAFVAVRPLARGGAVLQATRGCAGYKDRAVRRVFDALRPVLPAGEPQPLLAQHASLVFANAHPGVPAPPSPNLALVPWRGAPDQADGDDDEAGEDPALPEFRLAYQAPGGDAGSDPHAPPSFGHVWVLWRGDEPWCRFMDSAPEVEITRVRVMASMRIRGLTGRGVREWRPVEDDGTTAGYRAILSGAPKPP